MSEPLSSCCPRCGRSLSATDWWVTRTTESGQFVQVCMTCSNELGEGIVNPDDWNDDDEDDLPPGAEVEFTPASEVVTGP